jgi:hypothetical protein
MLRGELVAYLLPKLLGQDGRDVGKVDNGIVVLALADHASVQEHLSEDVMLPGRPTRGRGNLPSREVTGDGIDGLTCHYSLSLDPPIGLGACSGGIMKRAPDQGE